MICYWETSKNISRIWKQYTHPLARGIRPIFLYYVTLLKPVVVIWVPCLCQVTFNASCTYIGLISWVVSGKICLCWMTRYWHYGDNADSKQTAFGVHNVATGIIKLWLWPWCVISITAINCKKSLCAVEIFYGVLPTNKLLQSIFNEISNVYE